MLMYYSTKQNRNMEDTSTTPPSSPKQETTTTQVEPSVPAVTMKRGPGRPRKYPVPPTFAPPPITPNYTPTTYNNSPMVLDEMQKYLMKKKVKKYVQKYVQKYAPNQTQAQTGYYDETHDLAEEPEEPEEADYQDSSNLNRHRYAHSVGKLSQTPAKGSKLAQILGYK